MLEPNGRLNALVTASYTPSIDPRAEERGSGIQVQIGPGASFATSDLPAGSRGIVAGMSVIGRTREMNGLPRTHRNDYPFSELDSWCEAILERLLMVLGRQDFAGIREDRRCL